MDRRRQSPLGMFFPHASRSLLAVACFFCVWLPAHALSSNIAITGDEDGASLSKFDPAAGKWAVVDDATADAGRAIEQSGRQMSEQGFPLAIYQADSPKNAEISLRIKANGGKSNQDGGLAFRLKSPADYYLIELDALHDRALLSHISNGSPEEIVGVDADIASGGWHTLAVRAVDDKFTVSLDGAWIFTGCDQTLPDAGRIALWTKGDSITRFDHIAIEPLPAPGEAR